MAPSNSPRNFTPNILTNSLYSGGSRPGLVPVSCYLALSSRQANFTSLNFNLMKWSSWTLQSLRRLWGLFQLQVTEKHSQPDLKSPNEATRILKKLKLGMTWSRGSHDAIGPRVYPSLSWWCFSLLLHSQTGRLSWVAAAALLTPTQWKHRVLSWHFNKTPEAPSDWTSFWNSL